MLNIHWMLYGCGKCCEITVPAMGPPPPLTSGRMAALVVGYRMPYLAASAALKMTRFGSSIAFWMSSTGPPNWLFELVIFPAPARSTVLGVADHANPSRGEKSSQLA